MVKIALLSAAHGHARSYIAQLAGLPNAELVGYWDNDAERLGRLAPVFGCPAFLDIDVLLSLCDAVIVCSENAGHRALTEHAARAGKHVLCEKPLAITPDDARSMVDTCTAAGVQLMTAFPCRFSAAFGQLLTTIEAGELGGLLAIRGTNRGQCPGGWFIEKEKSGGGAVTDHAVHVTDLLRVLTGSEVESVYCEADNGILHGDFEDTGMLTLNFANGVFATLDSSWSRPKSFPTWGDVTLGVTGVRGVIELNMFGQESVLYSEKTGRGVYQGWGSNIDAGLVHAFIHALDNNLPVPVTGEDGLRAVEVVEAAYESIRTHQVALVRHR